MAKSHTNDAMDIFRQNTTKSDQSDLEPMERINNVNQKKTKKWRHNSDHVTMPNPPNKRYPHSATGRITSVMNTDKSTHV